MIAFSKLALGGRFGPARTLTDQARIFERGDAATHTWFLEHGAVEIVQSGDAGAEVVVKILVGPTLFGTIEALGDEPHYLESVRCLGAIRGYLGTLRDQAANLGPNERFLLQRIEGLERLAALK